MSRIYRYPLGLAHYQQLSLTGDPISVAPGRGDADHLDVWAFSNEHVAPCQYGFWVVGTGHPLPKAIETVAYPSTKTVVLGTCVMPDGLVWHVFWRLV